MNYKAKLHKVKAFIFDFDGVISDGKVWVIDEERQIRNSSVKDGYALQYAIKKGYKIAVITGGRCQTIVYRMNQLGVYDVFCGSDKKITVFKNYLRDSGLSAEEVLYMGDDIPDYEVMKEVGVATCPANAAKEIKAIVDYISHLNGGEGCVRDVIEQVLTLHDQWFKEDATEW